jgi:hypothetical protein
MTLLDELNHWESRLEAAIEKNYRDLIDNILELGRRIEQLRQEMDQQ